MTKHVQVTYFLMVSFNRTCLKVFPTASKNSHYAVLNGAMITGR